MQGIGADVRHTGMDARQPPGGFPAVLRTVLHAGMRPACPPQPAQRRSAFLAAFHSRCRSTDEYHFRSAS